MLPEPATNEPSSDPELLFEQKLDQFGDPCPKCRRFGPHTCGPTTTIIRLDPDEIMVGGRIRKIGEYQAELERIRNQQQDSSGIKSGINLTQLFGEKHDPNAENIIIIDTTKSKVQASVFDQDSLQHNTP